MRIGTRWSADAEPPRAVPETLVAAIQRTQLVDGDWTLTWLEGRPIAEHSSGVRLSLGANGAVHESNSADAGPGAELDDGDDGWLN